MSIPVRFQRVGDQPIVGIHPHEALAREIDVVLRTVDRLATERIGLVQAALEFVLDPQR